MSVPDIVTFGIPLMARAIAQDWDRIEYQLNATIGSIYNQTDPHFRIIVACTDRPKVSVPTDERLEFIACEQLPAVDHSVFITDAFRKRLRIAQRLKQYGGGYLMFTDHDDLVSRTLVGYVRETAHPNGYSVARGYMFDAMRGWLAPFPFADTERFDWESHTSAVLTFAADELPAHDTDHANRYWHLLSWGHPSTRPRAAEEGRPLLDIPFRAAVYVRNTGENVSTREAATTRRGRTGFQAHLDDQLEAQRIARGPELNAEFNLIAAEAPPSAARSMREFQPLVGFTVCVATHRRPAGLRRLLTALRPQIEGHPERDVVVVNDGTHDDDYAAVAKDFADIITYRTFPTRQGVVAARNATLEGCRAAYAVFTDDDCEPPPWWLDWLAARLRTHPEIDVVAGTTEALWDQKGFLERLNEMYLPRPSPAGKWQMLVTAATAIRAELLRQVGGFGYAGFAGGEDTEVCIRLHRAGARFLFDANWWVAHEVGVSIRTTARRYYHYGVANARIAVVSSTRLHLPGHVQPSQLGRALSVLPLLRANFGRMRSFGGGLFTRIRAAVAATIIEWSYLRGIARAQSRT